jgi:hypothetical protein
MTIRTMSSSAQGLQGLARRGAWVATIVALLVVLALSACSRGTSTQTVQIPTPTPTLPPTAQVIQTDADLDAIITALDSASVDAGLDDSAKDNVTVP